MSVVNKRIVDIPEYTAASITGQIGAHPTPSKDEYMHIKER